MKTFKFEFVKLSLIWRCTNGPREKWNQTINFSSLPNGKKRLILISLRGAAGRQGNSPALQSSIIDDWWSCCSCGEKTAQLLSSINQHKPTTFFGLWIDEGKKGLVWLCCLCCRRRLWAVAPPMAPPKGRQATTNKPTKQFENGRSWWTTSELRNGMDQLGGSEAASVMAPQAAHAAR